jgi:signal recognition particle receptor subunit beta
VPINGHVELLVTFQLTTFLSHVQPFAGSPLVSMDSSNKEDPSEVTKDEYIVVVEAEPLLRTSIRERVVPYLPPPVVRGWRQVDPILEPYLGPEPTVTLIGSLLLGFIVWQVLKVLSSLSSGRAITDDDDDQVITSSYKKEDFTDTILICGPSGAGKTRLLYHLCFGQTNVPTVTSLRANVEVSSNKIRFMDYPGHASLQSSQFLDILLSARGIVLVLDTAQPVAPVADVLYQLLAHAHKKKTILFIFVACHKADAPNAKNCRRIKIQLRTEMERLLKVRSAEEDSPEDLWWTPGKPLDLDVIPQAKLQFCSTSCETSVGMGELQDFCNGELTPEEVAQVERI